MPETDLEILTKLINEKFDSLDSRLVPLEKSLVEEPQSEDKPDENVLSAEETMRNILKESLPKDKYDSLEVDKMDIRALNSAYKIVKAIKPTKPVGNLVVEGVDKTDAEPISYSKSLLKPRIVN